MNLSRSIAQLVEHRSPKPGVGGSSPAAPAMCAGSADHGANGSPGAFIRQVRQEAAKVTWPTRKETGVSTASWSSIMVTSWRRCSSSSSIRRWPGSCGRFSGSGAERHDRALDVIHVHSGSEQKVATAFATHSGLRAEAWRTRSRPGAYQRDSDGKGRRDPARKARDRGAQILPRVCADQDGNPATCSEQPQMHRTTLASGQEHAEGDRLSRRRRQAGADLRDEANRIL